MKLSARTKQLLKNFATINQNILFLQGTKIRTIAQAKNVYAEAFVEEDFPTTVGIYDLNEFLGVIGLFDDPDVQFSDKEITIQDGKNSVRYLAADSTVIIAPKKDFDVPVPATSFDLDPTTLSSVIKAAGVLKSPIVTFEGDGENIKLVAHDKSNVNSNSYQVEVSENETKFKYHVKTESLQKLLSEKFEVLVLTNKLLVFKGDQKLYMVAAESDSEI